MRTGSRFLALSLISLAAACGGGGDDVQLEPDGDVVDQPDAEAPRECFADATYGAATFGNQLAESGGGTQTAPDGITAQSTLNAAEPFDVFQLELIKGYGVYTADITVGEHTLSGDELNYATCGLCARMFVDCTQTGCNPDQQFFVTGGTINVTSITPNLTYTVSDLTFVEVTINATTFESTPVVDGCETAITSGSFDAANTYTP